jgi:fibronectin type 3 domain-containing protein
MGFMMMSIRRMIVAVVVLAILCSITSLYAADLTISVNTGAPIRKIPENMYGGAMTAWWGWENGYNSTYNAQMLAKSQKIIRWPGGSWGDAYLWSDMEGPGGVNGWIINYIEENYMLSILNAEMQPIVNYPGYWYNTDHSLDDALNAAVAWVTDQSGRPHPAQYWEIGNETGGFWEAGWFNGINGTYYGDQFADFYLAMKAVNPNIKIGADAEPVDRLGNGGSQDYVGHWDHDMLIAAKAKGVVPDFFIIHQYPGGSGGSSYNPTLLSYDVDLIATYTSNMNTIINDTIGTQYVNKIGYFMTEWNAGGPTGYDRWRKYSGAMFMAEYLMKMSAVGWEGSTTFGDFFYQSGNAWGYPNFYVFPDWYLYPFFINKFGREMVSTSSSNSTVRAYSSVDASDNLTMFIVNNSPDANLTAQINISGMTIGTGGQRWIMEPAGTVPAGGTVQDVNDIQINGVFHPEPTTVNSLSPQTFTSGGSFTISLPKSCMVFLRMPSTGVDTTPPAAPKGLFAMPGNSTVALYWNDNIESDLASYNVYRSTTSGSGYVKQNNLPVSSSDYADYHVIIDETYYYVVRAVDTFWNESGNSSQVSIMLVDTTPPLPPTGLTASAGDSSVSLNWNDNNESDLAGYRVYRSPPPGDDYVQINGSLLSSSAYIDNSVENGQTYYYAVTAVDTSSNESIDGSNVVFATPQPSAYSNCGEVQAAGLRLASDLDGDCYVDFIDLDTIANHWLNSDCIAPDNCEGADFEPANGIVNLNDFVNFARQWLWCNDPQDPDCTRNW